MCKGRTACQPFPPVACSKLFGSMKRLLQLVSEGYCRTVFGCMDHSNLWCKSCSEA